jgi:hypothetical protein
VNDLLKLAIERRDPAARFAGTTRSAPWDELQAAYFAGEANWNYVVAPFIFARGGFEAEENGPASVAIDITNVAFR